MTQSERILAHLQAGNTLTPLEALDRFGCFRLGARVWDLKKEGHQIESRLIERNGKHFCEYWLPGPVQQSLFHEKRPVGETHRAVSVQNKSPSEVQPVGCILN